MLGEKPKYKKHSQYKPKNYYFKEEEEKTNIR